MNIFYLDVDIPLCATYHCDKHVVKMVLEYAQILSTVHHLRESDVASHVYKATHANHPCVTWANECLENYNYLFVLFRFMLAEYRYRYHKHHKSGELIEHLVKIPRTLPFTDSGMQSPPMCVPAEYKNSIGDVVAAYRDYYRGEKTRFARWTNRAIPYWSY